MLRAGLRKRSRCCGGLWRSPCPAGAGGSAKALSASSASPSPVSGGGARSGGSPPAGASNVKPLDGVKILDLTRILAGPFATMNLGDLGAEVIKVERPGAGDDTRAWGPPFAGTESVYFLSVNRNKKSIAINMKDSKGVKLIKELAAASDVFVENFVPGKLAEMGLGYEDIKKIAPHIVYCSITGTAFCSSLHPPVLLSHFYQGPFEDHFEALCGIRRSSHIYVTSELAEDASPPSPKSPMDNTVKVKQYWAQY